MQPPLLIDWLKQIHLTADSALASKRWKLANDFVDKVGRHETIQLLRIFLFPQAASQHTPALTDQFLQIDNEFPASNNTEEVRVMAGIIMVASEKKRSPVANAFALGIKAAAFPKQRCTPAHRGIVDEMGKYLDSKANELRPAAFAVQNDPDVLAAHLLNFAATAVRNDEPATKNACAEVAEKLQELYGKRIQRLSEETAILWWLLGGYSNDLEQEISGLSPDSYALVAANEVAKRTHLLPPPSSIYAILSRALTQCKGKKIKEPTLKDSVAQVDAAWRKEFLTAYPVMDCPDLTPIITALAKLEDSGDITTLQKSLQRACPGVATDLALPPGEAARQLYNELMFLKSLSLLP